MAGRCGCFPVRPTVLLWPAQSHNSLSRSGVERGGKLAVRVAWGTLAGGSSASYDGIRVLGIIDGGAGVLLTGPALHLSVAPLPRYRSAS